MATWHWADVYQRLDRVGRMIDAIGAPSPDAVERILRDRAAALARPEETPSQVRQTLELLLLPVGDERYGIERDRVLEVAPLRNLIPLPGTPAAVAGIVNWRGRMLAVINLAALFRLPHRTRDTAIQMVVVESEPIVFCLLATGPTQFTTASDGPTLPAAGSSERTPYIKQVTQEMVSVLDLGALAQAPEITINQEVQ